MPVLYYMPGAVCAQKVLLTASAKGVELETVALARADLVQPEYLRLNAKGVVPTMIDAAGRVIVESSTIMRYLDETFDGPPLQPQDAYDRSLMNNWLKLMDEELFPAIGYFTTATLLRESLAEVPRPELVKRMTQLAGAAVGAMRADAVFSGVAGNAVQSTISGVEKIFAAMDAQLSKTAWLAGQSFSLADAALLPAFLRLADLGLEEWWTSTYPDVAAWWRRISEHPPVLAFKENFPNPMTEGLHATSAPLRAAILAHA